MLQSISPNSAVQTERSVDVDPVNRELVSRRFCIPPDLMEFLAGSSCSELAVGAAALLGAARLDYSNAANSIRAASTRPSFPAVPACNVHDVLPNGSSKPVDSGVRERLSFPVEAELSGGGKHPLSLPLIDTSTIDDNNESSVRCFVIKAFVDLHRVLLVSPSRTTLRVTSVPRRRL